MSSNNFIIDNYIKHYTKKAFQLLDGRIIFCSYKHIYIYNSNLLDKCYDIDIDIGIDIVQLDNENIIISGTRAVQYRYKTKNINMLYALKINNNKCEINHYSEHNDPINKNNF